MSCDLNICICCSGQSLNYLPEGAPAAQEESACGGGRCCCIFEPFGATSSAADSSPITSPSSSGEVWSSGIEPEESESDEPIGWDLLGCKIGKGRKARRLQAGTLEQGL